MEWVTWVINQIDALRLIDATHFLLSNRENKVEKIKGPLQQCEGFFLPPSDGLRLMVSIG